LGNKKIRLFLRERENKKEKKKRKKRREGLK